MIEEITTLDQLKHVCNTLNLVVIDFYTTWCGPCKRIAPEIEQLANIYQQVNFYKINAENPELNEFCGLCEITSLPTFCFFQNKQFLTRIVGADINKIEEAVKIYSEQICQDKTYRQVLRV